MKTKIVLEVDEVGSVYNGDMYIGVLVGEAKLFNTITTHDVLMKLAKLGYTADDLVKLKTQGVL